MKLNIKWSRQFTKDYQKIKRQGKDLSKLVNVINILSNNEKLDKRYNDHKLTKTKEYNNVRELHIEPDWLLIYQIQNNELTLLLLRTGSHSHLF